MRIINGLRRAVLAVGLAWGAAALAAQPAATAKPAPDTVAAANVLAGLDAVHAIPEGKGDRVLVVFADPNCPYCRELYRDLRPWVGHDGLTVRWVLVAFLQPSSLGKAAAVLQAVDPLHAFGAMEEHGLNPNLPGPTPLSDAQVSPATRTTLDGNLTVLKRAGAFAAVPMIIFADRHGTPHLEMAVPSSEAKLKVLLQSVGPLPASAR